MAVESSRRITFGLSDRDRCRTSYSDSSLARGFSLMDVKVSVRGASSTTVVLAEASSDDPWLLVPQQSKTARPMYLSPPDHFLAASRVIDHVGDDGTLRLLWEVDLEYFVCQTGEITHDQLKEPPAKEADVLELLSSIRKSRNNSALNDFKIKCSDEPSVVYPCSKFVLSARSDYFKALFAHADCREVQEGEVEVEGCSGDALDIFLNLLYCRQDDRLSNRAMEVYALADRYQAPSAAGTCLQNVVRTLSPTNAVKVLTFADLYSIKDLERSALEVMSTNLALVKETQAWKLLTGSKRRSLLGSLAKLERKEREAKERREVEDAQREAAARHAECEHDYYEDYDVNYFEEDDFDEDGIFLG